MEKEIFFKKLVSGMNLIELQIFKRVIEEAIIEKEKEIENLRYQK